jgi:hypothetical protein
MQSSQYIATPTSKTLSLSEASWQVFSPFLCRYQWAFDNPGHSPRKTEIASAIINSGKKGCCTFWRPEGYRFKLKLLQDWAIEDAINKKRRIYYVSYGRYALLYLDIDLHYDWQKASDGQQAQQLLGKLMPPVFWAASSRGSNGYLKVDLQREDYETTNKLFDRLQDDLQLYLAHHKNLADFEIKGKIGFVNEGEYQWAQYGKLPLHCAHWNFPRLEEFKAKPTVSLRNVKFLCNTIEAAIPRSVLAEHKAYKKSLGDRPFFKGDWFLVTPAIEKAILEEHGEAWQCMHETTEDRDGNVWIHRECYRPGELPLTGREWREMLARRRLSAADEQEKPPEAIVKPPQTPSPEQTHKAVTLPLKLNIKLVDLASEPDSFKRQKEALMRFARYLKRVPTVEEALKYLRQEKLFTGSWEENQSRRSRRVHDILNFIAQTFDAGKCAQGSVNVGKYDQWARTQFPNGLIGKTRSSMDENGHITDGQRIHVSAGFIAAFMAIAEFGLVTDKNQDDSLPHHRAEELWQALYAKELISVPFCARKWAVCREAMVRLGIVAILDRDYHSGKAMKWAVGTYFPFLGLWKTLKVPSLLGSGCFRKRSKRREQKHNTLLLQRPLGIGLNALWMPARSPP